MMKGARKNVQAMTEKFPKKLAMVRQRVLMSFSAGAGRKAAVPFFLPLSVQSGAM
jgi:hypothetical protein